MLIELLGAEPVALRVVREVLTFDETELPQLAEECDCYLPRRPWRDCEPKLPSLSEPT